MQTKPRAAKTKSARLPTDGKSAAKPTKASPPHGLTSGEARAWKMGIAAAESGSYANPQFIASIHSAVELAERQAAEIEELRKALGRIADCTDAPDIDPTGEWQLGLHCGVEDRDCSDRYKAADYGYTCGIERALEWAANEARAAIDAKLSDVK